MISSLPNFYSVFVREIVLGRLATLVKSFVKTVSLARGLSEAAAETAGGKIFTCGSYRLGVHGPGDGIDTLCVVPIHVSRDDLFDVFEGMLRSTEGVTEVLVGHRVFLLTVAFPQALTCAGSPRCLRPHHQTENLGDPNRFSHGPSCALVNTRRLDLAG